MTGGPAPLSRSSFGQRGRPAFFFRLPRAQPARPGCSGLGELLFGSLSGSQKITKSNQIICSVKKAKARKISFRLVRPITAFRQLFRTAEHNNSSQVWQL